MARDPLQVLLRLRRLAVDDARRTLADRLRSEGAAADALAEIRDQMRQQTEIVQNAGTDLRLAQAFGTWLEWAEPRRRGAFAAVQAAEGETASARLVLADERAAMRAVETLIDKQDADRQAAAQRSEQRDLDEAGHPARGLDRTAGAARTESP